MVNRRSLLVDFQMTRAGGTTERDTVPILLDEERERGLRPRTLGADKGYDVPTSRPTTNGVSVF